VYVRRIVSGVVGVLISAGTSILRAVGITVGPRRRVPTDCNDPGTGTCGSNPRICGSSQAIVFGPNGVLAEYPTCGPGPHTEVRTQAAIRGLDASARTELRFAPAPQVTVQVVHFSNPGRVEAMQGAMVADMRPMAPTPGVVQQLTLSGTSIDRIVVTPASANDLTLVIGWCH